MSKDINKYNAKRALTMQWVAKQYGVSYQYVRNITNDSKLNSDRAKDIRKCFNRKYAELNALLPNQQ